MKRQNQSVALTSLFAQLSAPLLAVALLVTWGIEEWLVLAAPASAKVSVSQKPAPNILTIQVAERLPPPPQPSKFSQRKLPSSFSPREFDFQAPVPSSPSPHVDSYLVYVNDNTSLTLQEVQQLEPTAYVRQYKGRSVIQAGVFNKRDNAQQRAKELESRGIEARIVSLSTGQETDFRIDNSKSYFVVIPARKEDIPAIEDQVSRLGMNAKVTVSQTEEPRGSHVRVGPFPERGQAERCNRRLRDSGLRNARVYYGR
ncbi:SPOR domain-containing protein [Chroococcidiopsis sp. CCMEE 29]|uniref:SPOR domain-containing protein n=1 Tax=Chroococcidiopsis sp. CCMEE 29 TaxID=155894 RepID=UPI0020205D33|nr:SPOR domain-containing protein [Chroococcidiopsis sp. CCMEE 29]